MEFEGSGKRVGTEGIAGCFGGEERSGRSRGVELARREDEGDCESSLSLRALSLSHSSMQELVIIRADSPVCSFYRCQVSLLYPKVEPPIEPLSFLSAFLSDRPSHLSLSSSPLLDRTPS